MSIEIPNFSDLYRFCKLLNTYDTRDFLSFKNLFSMESKSFDVTFHFLEDICIITLKNNKITLKDSFNNGLDLLQGEYSYNIPIKQYLLESIINAKKSNIKSLIFNLLDEFKVRDSELFKKKIVALPIYKKKIITLLIDLNFLTLKNNEYIVVKNYPEIIKYITQRTGISQEQLLNILKEKDNVGKLAEETIFKYEQERLLNFGYAGLDIKIVGRKNVNYGYDIKSYDIKLNELIDIYIEVKAVSKKDFKFYWSKNEKEVAKQLKEQYYLYLLPFISRGKFEIDSLEVIKDPYNYFNKNETWEKTVELESFSK
ncbi:MAG: DUF3883 domain-containing protein [Bacteroidetes bacterium]|nr:DUF3883 domain-containing protein [Bacteroidota bacterium]